MKLYSANLSPFAAIPRLAIYAKGLPVEITTPAFELKSPAYLALNPMGKVPCLCLGDGTSVPESTIIVEYLEQAFPETPLLPADPAGASKARLLTRITELYVMTPLRRLFGQMDPANRDQAVIDAAFTEVEAGLDYLLHYLEGGDFAVGDSLSIADCQLVPTLFFVAAIGQAFGRDLIADRPKLAAYFEGVAKHAPVAKVLGEMGTAMALYTSTGQLS
jgi:glutathione S-transferase